MLDPKSPCKVINEAESSIEVRCPCLKYRHYVKRGDDGDIDYHYVVVNKKPGEPKAPPKESIPVKKKSGFFLFDKVDIGKKKPAPPPEEEEEEEEEGSVDE